MKPRRTNAFNAERPIAHSTMKKAHPNPSRVLLAILLVTSSILLCSCAEMLVGSMAAGITSASSENSIDVHAAPKELRGRQPRLLLSEMDIAEILRIVEDTATSRGLSADLHPARKDVLAAYSLTDGNSGQSRLLVRCIIHNSRQPEHLEIAVSALVFGNSEKRAEARQLKADLALELANRFGPDRIDVQ